MTAENSPLPPDTGVRRYLAVPARTDVLTLAQAWFAEAEVTRERDDRPQAPALVGARFRGIAAAAPRAPGEIRLTWSTRLVGPVDPEELEPGAVDAVPVAAREFHRLETDPGVPVDALVDYWLRAAARRAQGAAVVGREVTAPEPDSATNLALYSAVPLPPEVLVGLVRTVAPSAAAVSPPPTEEGIAPYQVVLPDEFDGDVTVSFTRASELPLCLMRLDWRAYGPFRYLVGWQGVDPDLAGAGAAGRIARRRTSPVIARATYAIARAAEGAVVDEDGFVLGLDQVARRAAQR